MARRWKNDLTWADVTPETAFLNRRSLMKGAGAFALASGAGSAFAATERGPKLDYAKSEYVLPDETLNTWEDITSYNNFYEFGIGKDDPMNNVGKFETEPWEIVIDGLCDKPGTYNLQDIMAQVDLEERIYRFRCVEAWSMVIPWIGFELKDLLDIVGVQPDAKYVYFETAYRPEQMPGTFFPILEWPYREGLRLDEAMHPLTIMATGLYGHEMPKQNGAPIRLVVPWKYGFKSIKSIVKISLTEEQPPTSWNMSAPKEYGFYSNVNPLVDHPRWSQASERRVGGGLFARRTPTLMFNGYEEVASLYDGMDLGEYF